jgi:mannose/cellobiose epimerase-like protein (N-acyl-D-glucosamine 2-epimerase family)
MARLTPTAPGMVYTLDWRDRPLVRERLHWVHAEASATAAALLRRTGEPQYEQWYRCFWDFIATHFIDRIHGSWHHELDPTNQPSAHLGWQARSLPRLQALLLPRLPLAPSLATALAL